MEKLVYLLRTAAETPGSHLRAALIDSVAATLRAAGATNIAVNVDDEDVAQGKKVRIAVQQPPIRAMVSFWMDNADDRSPCEAALREQVAALDGYLVAESVPMVNTRHVVPRGSRTPGVSMVTCINRLPSLSYEEFIDIWHGHHKRVAIETQSTFGYVRNVVVRRLTAEAPPRDGIVEEAFPIEALTDQKVWYAAGDSDEVLRRNLARMFDSVQRFLDLAPLESHPMSQYLLP
jgi:hypothetical protein